MKICMYIPTLNGGGAERVFVNLANEFTRQNIEVILISDSIGIFGKNLSTGVKFYGINSKSKFRNKYIRIVHKFILDIIFLVRVIKIEDPQVLMSSLALGNIKIWVTKLVTNSKFILVTRQANVLNTASKNILLNYFLKKAFKRSDLVIANSYDTKNSILQLFKCEEVLTGELVVIGNPVYTSEIHTLGNKSIDLSFLKYGRYILNVGRFTKEKDRDTLLEAYALLLKKIQIDLVIIGDGPLKKLTQERVVELGLSSSVHLIDFQDNPFPYYKNSAVFALSSNTEGFGNVIVEALAFNLPIVCTKCKGGPKFILGDGKYGTLVDLGDVQGFADALYYSIKNLNQSRDVTSRAKSFGIESISREYILALSRSLNS